jgi:pyridoxal phosphate enzyme (YggS family)
MSIADEIHAVTSVLPSSTRLIAVSKYHPVEAIREAYEAGQRLFGENRVQELCDKKPQLPSDIEWHLIGHLQTNKVKQVVPFVTLIHSVDSLKLLAEIHKEGEKIRRVVPCLLQIHIAREESKFGLTPEECRILLASGTWRDLHFVQIRGLMCMATLTDNEAVIRSEFEAVKQLFDECKAHYFSDNPLFSELSMGMSDDFHLAIEAGSTLVRVGSRIFGARVYAP